jgi:hypothetical protein
MLLVFYTHITSTNPKRRTTYLRSTCATCDAPLDTSELVLHLENPQLLCTRSQASDHLPLYCLHTGCGVKFKDLDALRQHSSISGHASVQCGVPGCITSLCTSAVEDHYIVVHSDNILYHCAQCNEGFETAKDLSNHGDGHSGAFVCEYPGCDSAATTIWDLRRHELKHRKNVQGYPCPRCPRYGLVYLPMGCCPNLPSNATNTFPDIRGRIPSNEKTIFNSTCATSTSSQML